MSHIATKLSIGNVATCDTGRAAHPPCYPAPAGAVLIWLPDSGDPARFQGSVARYPRAATLGRRCDLSRGMGAWWPECQDVAPDPDAAVALLRPRMVVSGNEKAPPERGKPRYNLRDTFASLTGWRIPA